jgi:4-hydroxybenzoate polyprenyltransferase/phosphoserine phosphatase
MNDIPSPAPAAVPLCVDLDGSLTPVDTLHESLLDLCRRSPRSLLMVPFWIARGKSLFKQKVAEASQIEASLLPIREELLTWLEAEKATGRRLVLATAANARTAQAIAGSVGLFDEVIASSEGTNLSGEHKRRALVERFGERGFDYVGNDRPDLEVWRSARQAIVVGAEGFAARAAQVTTVGKRFPAGRAPLRTWLKAIRVHQWVKNVLVFVPVLVGHRIGQPGVVLASLLAFFAFNFCASSVYVVNDLFDLGSDRRHPRKRRRPFAAGTIQASSGLALVFGLLAATVAVCLWLNPWFAAVLAAYYIVTWAYSLRLKRAAIVDVMTLAGLYTLRIIAGSAATLIAPSFWLLAFSMFVFLCLGIIKRYAELYDAKQEGKTGGHGRGYSSHDLELLMTMGIASGFSAVVVTALYINSPESQPLYRHGQFMWLICPLLLYWLSRMWLLASRGQMDDDPVVFAVTDKISLVTLALVALLAVAAV